MLQRSLSATLHRLTWLILPAWGLVVLTFSLWRLDLDTSLAVTAYWVTESGGPIGLPALLVGAVSLLVLRSGLDAGQRLREGASLVLLLLVLLGGMGLLNEHVIKPGFAVPRPNIEELAESGALGQSAQSFYKIGDKDARRAALSKIVHAPGFDAVVLDPRIRDHWAHETGYSFPSGHATAALTCATFFAGLALLVLQGWRLWTVLVLVPWAVLVCWSRTILGVHSPLDVSVGAAQGILLGVSGVILAWRWLYRDARPPPTAGEG